MRTIAFLFALGLVVSAQEDTQEEQKYDLKYRGKTGDTFRADIEWTYELDIKGDDATVEQVRAANIFFQIEKLTVKGTVVRKFTRGVDEDRAGQVHIEYQKAKITGTVNGEEIEYEFTKGEKRPDLWGDQIGGLLAVIFAVGKKYRLEGDGKVEFNDPNQEAAGEVLDLVMQAVVRMPDGPVAAGAEWTKVFKTVRAQKRNGARFEVTQETKLEGVEDELALITATLTGKQLEPEKKEEPKEEGGEGAGEEQPQDDSEQEASSGGRMEIVFDVEKGIVVSYESSGQSRFYYKGFDEEGNEQELEVTLKGTSKFLPSEDED
ncbi:MAG: hypothetical protein ACYTAF_12640 [Planctomycetota bacterium]|jgi:hypothetical protein